MGRGNTFLTLLTLVLLLVTACGGRSKTAHVTGGDTLQIEFASNLTIIRYDGYTQIDVRNPWDTLRTLHTYLLVKEEDELPASLPEGTVVRTPLKQALVYTSMHNQLLAELKSFGAVKGVCDAQYIKLDFVQKAIEEGTIIDCGSSLSPDMERIIALHPDAILLSPYENNGGYGKLGKLGTPIVECADYMETSPLGRAEWIYFYGYLTGKEELAKSIFEQVKKEYQELSHVAKLQSRRPTVLCELKSGGSTWYIPGGQSTTGRWIEDAGGQYVFHHLPFSGAQPLPMEQILETAAEADVWLFKYHQPTYKTYRELAGEDPMYTQIKAYKDRRVYGCNTQFRSFYEYAPFHPETVLKDIISILHPHLWEDYQPMYYSPLAE